MLERAGLIARSRSGQFRASALRREALDEAVDWMEACRARWDERLDRLDAHLARKLEETP